MPRHTPALSLGQRAADNVTALLGSWRFIIWQSAILALWIAINLTGFLFRWDPAPFILLNLCLSFQAAFTGPVVLMSSNRQTQIDRQHVAHIEHLAAHIESLDEALDQHINTTAVEHTSELHAVRVLAEEIKVLIRQATNV